MPATAHLLNSETSRPVFAGDAKKLLKISARNFALRSQRKQIIMTFHCKDLYSYVIDIASEVYPSMNINPLGGLLGSSTAR